MFVCGEMKMVMAFCLDLEMETQPVTAQPEPKAQLSLLPRGRVVV